MKKIFFTSSMVLFTFFAQAQQTTGRVTYDRIAQMTFNIADNNSGEQSQTQTRTDKFELLFGNNQSLWKQAEKENEDDGNVNQGGMQIRMIVAGSDDVLYNNFTDAKRTELRVFFDKKFIIDDSIRPLKWKMGEETKTILNHVCRKATATNTSKRMTMNINNGVMERKEIDDTSNITAWFATDIPVAAGPAEYQGQLPGLILAIDINNGRQVYKAVDISEKADIVSIKAPTGKKHYTPAEFRKERDKMMEEMQQNNGGGNRTIRVN
ncbi:MAG: GLPGLI family protein [Ferruginibacter sp.]